MNNDDAPKAETFQERLARFRAEKELSSEAEKPSTKPIADNSQPQVDPDLIPNVYERSETDEQIDRVLGNIGILQAYNKWVGKEVDASTLGRDEVMVSCPKPDHRDSHPSAWVNPSKGTWFCGGCQEGGDIYDIAAMYEPGFTVSTYKEGTEFHKLREKMFEAFGGHVDRGLNFSETVWVDPDSEAAEVLAPADNVIEDSTQLAGPSKDEKSLEQVEIVDGVAVEPLSLVTPLPVEHEDDLESKTPMIYPVLDWRAIVRPNTFLHEYVRACSEDDSPEEYHFWNGMIALGHAAGRRVVMKDRHDVFGNLLLVILGETGIGKSKSRRHLGKIMREVFPYQNHGSFTSGVLIPPIPGSGEALIGMFSIATEDPNALSNPNPKAAATAPKTYISVNGMVEFDEFSGVVRRVNRTGSTLEGTILSFADMNHIVSTNSRTGGDLIAEKPFCSITSSSQPEALRGLITKENAVSGFLNRWLFVTGEEKKREWLDGSSIDLSRATDMLKQVKLYCGTERRLKFTADAHARAEAFFDDTIVPIMKNDSTALLKRMDLMMKKMMLLFAINAGEAEISLDTVERTLPIFDYLVACYGLVHEQVGITQNWEIGEKVFDCVKSLEKKLGKSPTSRDISRSLHRQKYSAEQINRTLAELIKIGRVEELKPESKVGRPSVRFKAVS